MSIAFPNIPPNAVQLSGRTLDSAANTVLAYRFKSRAIALRAFPLQQLNVHPHSEADDLVKM